MSDPIIKPLFFDIEATGLEASFGRCLCIGFKYLGDKKTQVVSINDVPKPKKGEEPDAPLMRYVHDLLTNKAQIICSWYGKEYDRKFLNTRMLMAGLSPLPPLNKEHIDLFYTARGNLKMHSLRLQGVSEGLGCPISKTPVRADVWRKAQRDDKKALDYVIDHCAKDVDILEWVYKQLRPFVRQHPRVGKMGNCPNCGSDKIQSRGRAVTLSKGAQTRTQCQGCGLWGKVAA